MITQDNYYWYDGLQQVTRHDRGNLTPSGGPYTGIDPTTRQQQEDFTYDETGNWPGYQSSSPSLAQTRTHNKGNEITAISNPSSVVQPVYDPTGNMTTIPKPDDWTTDFTCKWDAWNRLVEVKQGSSTVIATYAYDQLSRRTKKTAASVTTEIYYNRQWRPVEERISSSVKAQYVWSPADRWTLLRRKRSVSGTLDETVYCLRDYLDPVAIVDGLATVQERYGYDAFGKARIMDPNFATIGSSSFAWSWLFHGEFQDPETLLYNYGYRYYHTALGRWLSRDAIGILGGVNLYAFLNNDGLQNLDAFGLDKWKKTGDRRFKRREAGPSKKFKKKETYLKESGDCCLKITDEVEYLEMNWTLIYENEYEDGNAKEWDKFGNYMAGGATVLGAIGVGAVASGIAAPSAPFWGGLAAISGLISVGAKLTAYVTEEDNQWREDPKKGSETNTMEIGRVNIDNIKIGPAPCPATVT